MGKRNTEMLKLVEITLSNDVNDLKIYYEIYEWPAARKWLNLLESALDKKFSLVYDTSFNITDDDRLNLLKNINRTIDDINQKYDLKLINVDENNIDVNDIHRKTSCINCDLWVKINDLIHAYEQYESQKNREPRANAYFKFVEKESISLEKEDYFFFSADRNYGDLCNMYTFKGKHWLEIATDNDIEAITDGQLHVENKIEAGGYMLFRPPSPTPFFKMNKFIEWYRTNVDDDFKLEMGIGYLLIGRLIMPDNWILANNEKRDNWTRFLCQHKKITNIRIINSSRNDFINLMNISNML